MQTILLVDDEPNYLVVLSELLREEGFEVITAENGEKAFMVIEKSDLDLVITDMNMPGMDGLTLLKASKSYNNALPVIMITAFGEIEKAVNAMQAGAFNYLTKPFNNDELVVSIRKAIDHYSLVKENVRLRDEMQNRYGFDNIIGKNKQMQHLYTLIDKMAPTPSSVLVTGESGTGKELVARALHFNSPRREAPCISINCAALPESLLESELFGHEKGAFTGAVAMRKGRFEQADRGTLFLDEIGEMALPLQSKLLRVLQDHTFERIGGEKSITVDVRIVTATNKDLKKEVEKGLFREDLYYRLNVLHIHLPPLRERKDDIPMLAAHFIANLREKLNRSSLEISPDALRYLTSLSWEGNVRELENSIEQAAILCSGYCIEPEDLQLDTPVKSGTIDDITLELDSIIPAGVPLPKVLNTIEKKMLQRALNETNHIQAHAAERLGITKSLLQYKMKKYGIKKR